LYVVADVYPHLEGPHFASYVGAVAGCWIRRDLVDEGGAPGLVRDRLATEGWTVARTISTEMVSPASYTTASEARDRFEQASIDGFVAQFHRRRREVILSAEHDDELDDDLSEVAAYRLFIRRIRERGPFSLFSAGADQWAHGVSPDGDDFLPIWVDAEAIRPWTHGWPGYEVRPLSDWASLSEVLQAIGRRQMWAAIEVGPNALMTTHAIGLQQSLFSASPHPT
jgi:hypothetical protein